MLRGLVCAGMFSAVVVPLSALAGDTTLKITAWSDFDKIAVFKGSGEPLRQIARDRLPEPPVPVRGHKAEMGLFAVAIQDEVVWVRRMAVSFNESPTAEGVDVCGQKRPKQRNTETTTSMGLGGCGE